MSTYANVTIDGREFCVRSGGWVREDILDTVREYVKETKGKVKPGYIARVVVDAIASEAAADYYAPFQLGFCEFPAYHWIIDIGERGGVRIKGGRSKP